MKQYKTAVYLRISKAEGEGETDSIQNQRAVVAQYAAAHPEMTVEEEFVDDGYSGRNFRRPAFLALEKKLREGVFDCVIVKDLSRLGRNYVETGRYVEQLFPLWGVRLVAVTDGVDTAQEGQKLFVPLKNLINDWYSRDIGRKVSAGWQVKRQAGWYLGPFAPYGYAKKGEGALELAPEQAKVVQKAARWVLEGASLAQTANRLNTLAILPPAEQKQAEESTFFSGFRLYGKGQWSESTLRRMFFSPVYGGGEKWPAILSPLERRALERLCHRDLHQKADGGCHLLSGLLFCGQCGRQMQVKVVHRGKKTYRYGLCAGAKEGKCDLPLVPLSPVEEGVRAVLLDSPLENVAFCRLHLVQVISKIHLWQNRCQVIFAREAMTWPDESDRN